MSILLYLLGVVGVTHIIVDPATIMQPIRKWSDDHMPQWFNKLVSCYQCCGFWVGGLFSLLLFEYTLWMAVPMFFMGGGAGSFVSTLAAVTLNWLEANSVIDLDK